MLTLEQMYFADEVDEPASILPDALPDVPERELQMGLSLIQSFAGDWEPAKYSDTYRDALCTLVEQKRKGHEVRHVQAPEEDDSPPDLMEALRRSLEQVEGGRGRRRNGSSSKRSSDLSKSELEERARELEIPGRSKMSKDELAAAVASAE